MRKRALPTEIDRSFGWITELMGFDAVEQRILVTFARWTMFDGWRELVRKSPHGCNNLTVAMIAQLSGLPTHMVEQRLAPGAACSPDGCWGTMATANIR
jgi:hypothetical protein